jgi:hypothetical protein
MIPRRLGADEYMHVDLHTRITVNAAESHPMHSAFVSSHSVVPQVRQKQRPHPGVDS